MHFFPQKFSLPLETMRVVFEGTYSELKLLNIPSEVLKDLGFFKSNKVKLLNNNIIIVLFN